MTQLQTTFRVEARRLVAALARLMPLVKDNPIMPAYSSVLIEPSYGQDSVITLTAGSDSQRITVRLDEVSIDGELIGISCCPEIAPLYKLLQTQPDVPVWITNEDTHLTLSSAKSQSKLPIFPSVDYPQLKTDDEIQEMRFSEQDAAVLATELDRISGFASNNVEYMPQFAGVWISSWQEGIKLEACNSRIITDATLSIPATLKRPILLPVDSIKGIVSMLQTGRPIWMDERVSWIGFYDNIGDELWIRKLSADYPQFERLWPRDEERTEHWTVERSQLISSLKSILSLPGLPSKAPTTHLARLNTDEAEPILSYDFTDYHIREQAGDWEGRPLEWACGLDAKNLLTLAGSFTGETLYFTLNAAANARKFLYVEDGQSTNRAMQMALTI